MGVIVFQMCIPHMFIGAHIKIISTRFILMTFHYMLGNYSCSMSDVLVYLTANGLPNFYN